jgi:hypothetical protein
MQFIQGAVCAPPARPAPAALQQATSTFADAACVVALLGPQSCRPQPPTPAPDRDSESRWSWSNLEVGGNWGLGSIGDWGLEFGALEEHPRGSNCNNNEQLQQQQRQRPISWRPITTGRRARAMGVAVAGCSLSNCQLPLLLAASSSCHYGRQPPTCDCNCTPPPITRPPDQSPPGCLFDAQSTKRRALDIYVGQRVDNGAGQCDSIGKTAWPYPVKKSTRFRPTKGRRSCCTRGSFSMRYRTNPE